MISIPEGHLSFDFDPSWDHVEKWDDSKAYREGIHKVSEIDALDIIAFSETHNECLLLEIRDFRDLNESAERRGRLGKKRRKTAKTTEPSAPTENQVSAQLTEKVAQKVAGTVAGLAGAARMRDEPFAKALAAGLTAHKSAGVKVRVVLWVEGQPTSKGKSPRGKANLSALTQALKHKVAWLTNHPVQVLSTASRPGTIPGLTVLDQR